MTVGVAANQVASVNYREAGTLTLNTSATPRITILSDGKVGINQANPTEKLHVDGNIRAVNGIFSGDVSAVNGIFSTNVTGVDATFSGNVSIGGTLTYEDVTNVDAVGLGTFREGIFIPDNKELEFGNTAGSGDLQIYHLSATSNNFISAANNSDITISAKEVELMNQGHSSYYFKGTETGSTVYYNNTARLATTTDGVKIYGGLQDKDGDLGSSGQVLTSTGTELNWVNSSSVGTDTNTLYDLEVIDHGSSTGSGSGNDTIIRLNPSSGTNDDVRLIAGSNVTLSHNTSNDTITISSTNTNTQLSVEQVQDIVGAMVSGNTETNISVTYDDPSGKLNFVSTDTNTQLTTEQVQDIVGAMFSGNTETRISATYQDSDGTIDLVVDDQSSDNNTTYDLLAVQTGGNNDNPSIKLDASTGDDDEIQIVGGANVTVTRNSDSQITISSSDTDTNTQLSTEQVQDIVGAMFSGNTETRITATYQDSDGTIDLIVDDQSSDNNTTFSISAVDGDNTDEEKIRLTGANPSSTDDVVLEAGSGLSIARSGDKITFTSDGANVTTSQNPPSSPNSGDLWWDTDDGELHLYYNDGSSAQWVSAGASGEKGVKGEAGGGAPVGQIVAWSGSAGSLPDGYFLCDGSAISRTTYAALFAVVGTTHGSGNGSTTFNIPDLRDRFVVGASNSTGDTTYPGVSPGATGGNANAVVVTHDHDADASSNVSDPGHRHSSRGFGTDDDGGDQHTGSGNNSVRNNAIEDATTGINVSTNIDIDNEGESGTGKNLPPYYALAYIMKT